ncbi:hypothetical protein HZC32_00855 [Candidatus Woesearchaeota archaeon]|nr:hypothetical protein [Candidatus Woesearchaeota archaeon]
MNSTKRIGLKDKGWSEQEIRKAESILEKAEWHDVFFSKIAFWTALAVIVFANIAVSLILIPFLVFFESWILYSIVAL